MLSLSRRGVWGSFTAAGKKRVRSSLVERAFHFIRLTAFVISLNVHRRHMDKTQLACVPVRALPHYEEEAKERQREHGGTAPGRPSETVKEKFPEVSPQSRDLAAASVGVNPRYVSDAKRIQQEAPETLKDTDTIGTPGGKQELTM